MSLGWGPLKSNFAPSGGSSGGGFVGTVRKVAPVTVPVSVRGSGTVQMQPRADFKSFYDPSRVIDVDKLKVVADLRTQGSERGETQQGDDGMLGPGSGSGAFVSAPRSDASMFATTETKPGLTPAQLALIALGSFLVFGG